MRYVVDSGGIKIRTEKRGGGGFPFQQMKE